jgi:hypothetical protein
MSFFAGLFQTQVFLSHQPELETHAKDIASCIEARGHQVVRSADSGRNHGALPDLIGGSDAFIFLITPQSIAPGSRTMSELQLAQRRWPVPDDHVLPVAVAKTKLSSVPAYLRSVDILKPRGHLGLDIAGHIDRIAGRPNAIILAALLGLLGAFAGLFTTLLINAANESTLSFYFFPGLFTGLVVGLGVWLMAGRRFSPALAAVIAVMAGWFCAYSLWRAAGAQFAGQDFNANMLRFFTGAVFGATTLLALSIIRRSFRRLDLWVITLIVGGFSWVIANWIGGWFGLPGNASWWVIWQALFAAWIGFWLPQPKLR